MKSTVGLCGNAPCAMLDEAIGSLSILFQPIFEIRDGSRRLHSLESLARGPRQTPMESADVLFEYARRHQQEVRIDRACIRAAFQTAALLPGSPPLSINVHASTLELDADFPLFLERAARQCSIPLARLTVEIVEHIPFWDGARFLEAIGRVRNLGAKVAMDDFGMGHSNYRTILSCRPDYFKIDRSLVKGACADFYQRAVLESVSQLARRVGARVVAEGVEDGEDLNTVLSIGINLVQGYLFARPLSAAELIESDLLDDYRGCPTLPLPSIQTGQLAAL
jgi:EAL domain-containing protein (putative c-di-GMP-specific phosphodiesterase class I)